MVLSGKWLDPVEPYISLRGMELAGKVAGIIGFGAIGSELSRRLLALDMQVLVYDPYVSFEKIAIIGARKADLNRLLAQSDFVSIHCPVTSETREMLGAKEISLLKPTAFLINTAGWEIVDETALLGALKEKRIAGAAFDIYQTHPVPTQSPFLKLDNVILTPHIGGATDGTVERYSRMICADIERFLDGEQPRNLVNPEAWKRRGG